MAKQRAFTMSIAHGLLAFTVVALIFSRGLSFWFLLTLTVWLAMHLSVELLTQNIPVAIRSQSNANCFRLDDTRSERRTARERKHLRKFRSDLWAIFLMVAFIGTCGIFVVHTQFAPLTLTGDVVSALREDPSNFKSQLRQRNVDRKLFQSIRRSSSNSHAEIKQHMKIVWYTWPVVALLGLAGCAGSIALIRYAYMRTLREFHQGVTSRATEYLNLDTGRLVG